jgi:hypothetical protein
MFSHERSAHARRRTRVSSPPSGPLVVLLVACAASLCSCAVIGPRSISGGRGAYTEVINTTQDEQILNVMVRMRYNETFGMLAVASITAGLRFRA